MGQSDLDLLLEMGFERDRAELAVKRTGGCTFWTSLGFSPPTASIPFSL